MTAQRLSLLDLRSDTPVTLGHGAKWFTYAPEGGVDLTAATTRSLGADEGLLGADAVAVTGIAWIWLLAPQDLPLPQISGVETVFSVPLAPDFEGPAILRADRVASQSGARTPLHGHRGPGIRRLLRGHLRARIGGMVQRILPGEAWFETGHPEVIGENVSGGENVFIRVMLLPPELAGGASSFVPATPEEAARPRAAQYRLFGEIPATA